MRIINCRLRKERLPTPGLLFGSFPNACKSFISMLESSRVYDPIAQTPNRYPKQMLEQHELEIIQNDIGVLRARVHQRQLMENILHTQFVSCQCCLQYFRLIHGETVDGKSKREKISHFPLHFCFCSPNAATFRG